MYCIHNYNEGLKTFRNKRKYIDILLCSQGCFRGIKGLLRRTKISFGSSELFFSNSCISYEHKMKDIQGQGSEKKIISTLSRINEKIHRGLSLKKTVFCLQL